MITLYMITYEQYTNDTKRKKPRTASQTEVTQLNPIDFFQKKLKSKKWDGCLILNVFEYLAEDDEHELPEEDDDVAGVEGSL